MKYNHLQIGKVAIAFVILSAIVSVIAVMAKDFSIYTPDWMDTANWDAWGIAIIVTVYLTIINMCMLRIQVDHKILRWYFGVGFPGKKISLETIETVNVVRNKWWYGWGIRKLVSGGWLYNVNGLDAVEVKTDEGKIVRLGTDEPKQLARALKNQVDKLREGNHG